MSDMLKMPDLSVWSVALEDIPEPCWPLLCALLDPTEAAQSVRFAHKRHRRQYVAAHALKRLMLSEMCGISPEAWRFVKNKGGKPRVATPEGPHFNLSHCEGRVACGVRKNGPLGVDVESIDRELPLDIALNHFTEEEQAWLLRLPEEGRRLGFFRLWTLKEAFVKATGTGLAQPLNTLAFHADSHMVSFHDTSLGDPRSWVFYERHFPAHTLSVAWQDERVNCNYAMIREVRMEMLLEAAGY